jgi:hypothetical protein
MTEPLRCSLRRGAGLSAIALTILAQGQLARAEGPSGVARRTSGRVQGKLMTEDGRREKDEAQVFIQGHKRVVVRDGSFSLPSVPPRYDLWIAAEKGHAFVAYQGLSRRSIRIDPLEASADGKPNRAQIQGILRGDFAFPIRENAGLNVYFFSNKVSGIWQANPVGGSYGVSAGPRFGRMSLAWRGEASVTGQLVALGQIVAPNKLDVVAAALATTPITIHAGEEASAEMTLRKLPSGRIAGAVSVEGKDMVREIGFSYRLPDSKGAIWLKTCPVLNTYDCALPDLSVLGGDYCGLIHYDFYTSNGRGETRLCGGQLGMADFSFRIGSPPRIHDQGKEPTMAKHGRLAWTDPETGVYKVDLSPDYRRAEELPHFTLFTAETSIAWPDFEALGGEGHRIRRHPALVRRG